MLYSSFEEYFFMADLSVEYLGLELRNPVVIASSPLTGDIGHLKACQEKGAGAVVLKSIFQEQIDRQIDKEILENEQYLNHGDAASYYEAVSRDYYLDKYLSLVREAKKELDIPVIASINCMNLSGWTDSLKKFEAAGADAIELNYYPIAADSRTEGAAVDRKAIEFVSAVRKASDAKISVKIGYKYSSLASIIKSMDSAGADGLVLFNRFYRPDIDIESMTLSREANPLSSAHEYADTLRWIALMSAEVKCDLAASTGIHDGQTVIKMLLAGAACTQVCTAAMKDLGVIEAMCETLSSWMDRHGFKSIGDFKGRLAQENMANGSLWERTQYIRKLSGER